MGKYSGKFFGWIMAVLKKRVLTFSVGFAFALLCFVAVNAAMQPVSESKYCGTKCHEMHTALHTWSLSVHGSSEKGLRAECIDCHLPEKDNYFRHIVAKAFAGGKDMYKHYMKRFFGGEYEAEKIRISVLDRMANENCTRCHVDLLGKPGNETIREAHTEALNIAGETSQVKCVECHDDVGHMR